MNGKCKFKEITEGKPFVFWFTNKNEIRIASWKSDKDPALMEANKSWFFGLNGIFISNDRKNSD